MSFVNYNPATQGMGIGSVGVGDPNAVFKRKNRFTFEISSNSGSTTNFNVPPYFVKVAGRPNVSFEETEINFLNDKMWIPGKATWEAITVTFLDVAGTMASAPSANLGLYQWLMNVFNFSGSSGGSSGVAYKAMSSKVSCYAGTAQISLFDGCGNAVERWQISDAWPQAINFGDLEYASSDPVEIEVTLRYSKVYYFPVCPTMNFTPSCCGCS